MMGEIQRLSQFVLRRPILRTAIVLGIMAVLAVLHLEITLSRLGDAA